MSRPTKRVCWVLAVVGLAACSSRPTLNRAQNARVDAIFACVQFASVYPTAPHQKVPLTNRQRTDQVSKAVATARAAASQDDRWNSEARRLDALTTALRSHDGAAVSRALVDVRTVCDPLDANGLTS